MLPKTAQFEHSSDFPRTMPISPSDPRLKSVGFAKLAGENVDHIMRKYEIVLGRKSKASPVDVVLGDMMSVSRQHAKIYFNFEKRKWALFLQFLPPQTSSHSRRWHVAGPFPTLLSPFIKFSCREI